MHFDSTKFFEETPAFLGRLRLLAEEGTRDSECIEESQCLKTMEAIVLLVAAIEKLLQGSTFDLECECCMGNHFKLLIEFAKSIHDIEKKFL